MKARAVFYIIAIVLLGAVVYATITAETNRKGDTPAGSPQATDAQPPAVAEVGKPAPGFTLPDAQGDEHTLSSHRGKYVVLEWFNAQCPFVGKYYNSGTMQKLQQTYRDKGVVWLTICSSAKGKQGYYEGEALTNMIRNEKSNATAYLVDADGTVGRRYDAKTTPDMFIISPEGVLLYAGAIDNKPSVRQSDLEGATNYVVEALDAAMAGQEIKTKSTKSYGCSVKY